MSLDPKLKPTFAALVDAIASAITCAGDPHLDGRDEAYGWMERAAELVDELFEPDDQADPPCRISGTAEFKEGGPS